MSNIIDARDRFPQERDSDICAVANRLWSPYQHHTRGDRVGLFQGHSDPNAELDRLARVKGRCPTPEGM